MKFIKPIMLIVLLFSLCGCSVPSKGVKVFFFKEGVLTPVEREVPTNENQVVIAIDQLLKGPNEQESAAGFTTKIPVGTRSRNVDVEGNAAIIDLNSTLIEYKGGAAEAKMIVAQIVSTAASVKGIKQVILKLQGSDEFLVGPGYTIDHPLTMDDVKI